MNHFYPDGEDEVPEILEVNVIFMRINVSSSVNVKFLQAKLLALQERVNMISNVAPVIVKDFQTI